MPGCAAGPACRDIALRLAFLRWRRLLANSKRSLSGAIGPSVVIRSTGSTWTEVDAEASLRAISRSRRRHVAYLDTDDFKAVNDARGHKAGDNLLRAVAEVIQSSVRSSDLAARLGGDEFAMLLGPDEARQNAGKITCRTQPVRS